MNYYNPYFSTIPFNYTPALTTTSPSFFSRIFGSGGLSSFINGTKKTLDIVNQTIPLVKQVSPVVKNARTMFKVMNEFKRVDTPVVIRNNSENSNNISNYEKPEINSKEKVNTNGPTFFL